MEDAHITDLHLTDQISLFGVYDGHGGKEVSNYIAKNLLSILKANENFKKGLLAEAISETYLEIDKRMATKEGKLELHSLAGLGHAHDFARKPEDNDDSTEEQKEAERKRREQEEEEELDSFKYGTGSGSTAVTAIINGKEILVANCGDSRCVLSRDFQAIEMSVDHKPTTTEEYDRISKAGGFVANGRVMGDLNLSRAIGDMQYKQNQSMSQQLQMITADPEIKKIEITTSDQFLILACDGVWDVKSSQQAVDYVHEKIKENVPLERICELLLDECLAKSAAGVGTDNMTVIIVAFNHFYSSCSNNNSESNSSTHSQTPPTPPQQSETSQSQQPPQTPPQQ